MHLNLSSDDEPSRKKKGQNRSLKIILGLAAVILVPTIGSTLAGGITVGSGSLEFGQGVVTTAACDTSITVLPTTAYAGDTFTLSTIVVSNLDTSGCNGKALTLKVLSGSTAQVISTGTNTTLCRVSITIGGSYATATDSCGTISGAGAAGFTLTPSATLGAVFVDRITVESS
jgi:hypothetical protein